MVSRNLVVPIVSAIVTPTIAGMYDRIRSRFSAQSIMTLVTDQSYYELFPAAETYMAQFQHHLLEAAQRITVIVRILMNTLSVMYDNIQVKWKSNFKGKTLVYGLLRSYELSFEKKYKDEVMNLYLPYILQQGKAIQEQTKIRKSVLLRNMTWVSSTELDKSITFSSISMDTVLKEQVIHDLNTFMNAEEYYRKTGKARKRTYLISGLVDVDKSRLISAIANLLNYNIYEADLSEYIEGDDIRDLLLHFITRSVLVIKDIESPIQGQPSYKKRKSEAPARIHEVQKQNLIMKLLRSINGLWLPRGNELIIILTTSNREKIEPTLLKPGRINMQIDFSHSTENILD